MTQLRDVAVVGAGISGLTTAFWLRRAGLDVVVIESSARVGGAITTHADGDWLFELGPNTVLDGNPAVAELIAAAGLTDERIEAAPAAKKRFVWKGDRLVPLPSGPIGFLTTSLFSAAGKLRILREPWIPPRRASEDESIADFARRRLGPEMLEFAVGPFVSGVYAGDPERLSVRHATAKIHALEHEHGSLIRGAIARRKGPAPRGSMISFRGGLATLPERLADACGELRLGVGARRLLRGDRGPVLDLGGERIHARRVVLATPPDATADLLGESMPKARALADIPSAPVVVVGMGFEREAVAHPLDGFGFLAPRSQSLRILGCLFPSSLFPARAPTGSVALSAFLGGRTDPAALDLDDSAITTLVRRDLERALGLRRSPTAVVVRRWPRAIPQYEVGHGRYLDLAVELETGFPGLHLAGNWRSGVSVPDCIRNGADTARRILTVWARTNPTATGDELPYVARQPIAPAER